MAQKTSQKIDLTKITENIPDHLEGVKPYIESPEVVIKKAIRTSLLVSLTMIIITILGIYFVIGKISKLSADLQNKENLIYTSSKQSAISSDIVRQWTTVQPNFDKIENSLPSSNDLLGYVGVLEKIAQDSGVQQNIKLQASPAPKTANSSNKNQQTNSKGSSISHTVDLKGNLGQFIQYLSSLEKAPYFTQLTTLNISSNQGLTNESTATIGIKLYTYE